MMRFREVKYDVERESRVNVKAAYNKIVVADHTVIKRMQCAPTIPSC